MQNGVVKEREEAEEMQLRTRRKGMRIQGRDLVGGRVMVEEERGRRSAVQQFVGLNDFVNDRGGVMEFVKGVSLRGSNLSCVIPPGHLTGWQVVGVMSFGAYL